MADITKQIPSLVRKFITGNNIAHIATISVDQKSPQIATVYYVYRGNAIYFATRPQSVKIKNILANNRVAIVISDAPRLKTLQLSANAEILKDPKLKTEIVKSYNKIANGAGPEFLPLMKTAGFSIEIVGCQIGWFRYSDFRGKKQTMIEKELKNLDA